MQRFDHIDIEVIVRQNRATGRRNTDGDAPDIQLINDFGNNPVCNTVTASRTVVKNIFLQTSRSFKNSFNHIRQPLHP
ncbi:MAG: hypothetical protein BWX55_01041 [Deltaproteobacteria bacterium ADurb.Bin022]|nr:MAG: hypothetical protein BWX55_01041 [Deltaproteobacteria bacterium ADurb.Bin022]